MNEKYGERMDVRFDAIDAPEYVRGHVTEQEAREALRVWNGRDAGGSLELVHMYARWRPCGDGFCELLTSEHKSRGMFELTEIRHGECHA